MSLPAITELLPHRGPALLIDRADHWDESHIVCSAEIENGHPYMQGDRVPAIVGLEMMAQAVAAYVGMYRGVKGGAARIGYLVGARHVDLHVDDFTVGEILSIVATPVFLDRRAGAFECHIDGPRGRLVDATLTVYEPAPAEMNDS